MTVLVPDTSLTILVLDLSLTVLVPKTSLTVLVLDPYLTDLVPDPFLTVMVPDPLEPRHQDCGQPLNLPLFAIESFNSSYCGQSQILSKIWIQSRLRSPPSPSCMPLPLPSPSCIGERENVLLRIFPILGAKLV